MVWYLHLFKDFPQFVVEEIYTIMILFEILDIGLILMKKHTASELALRDEISKKDEEHEGFLYDDLILIF